MIERLGFTCYDGEEYWYDTTSLGFARGEGFRRITRTECTMLRTRKGLDWIP